MKQYGNRKRISAYFYDEDFEQIEEIYKSDNCQSKSEFITKATKFYIGYLISHRNEDYLGNIVTGVLQGITGAIEARQTKLLFKIAVELAKVQKILAGLCDINEDELYRLQKESYEEVRRVNGIFTFDKAVKQRNV